MIHYESVERLVRAVESGRIMGQSSARVLKISPATFWRWVKSAEERGVRFRKNRRGDPMRAKAWAIVKYGPYRKGNGK